MFPRISQVRHLQDYELEIGFSDGTLAKLDFRGRIARRRGVIAALRSVDFFAQVSVDREAGTLIWPNGVDFCPDVLYSEATGKDIARLSNEFELT